MKKFIELKKTLIPIISFLSIIGILVITGCVDKTQSEPSENLEESDIWYNFADLFTPGYYISKGSNDILNNILDIHKILENVIPDSDFDEFKTLINSIDMAVGAGWIESYFIEAGGKCGQVSISDKNEKVPLHEALRHFGDLYNDDNPDTNPTVNDFKNTRGLAECFLDKYSTKSPEGKYLSQVTKALIKLLDSKISSVGQTEPKATKVSLEEGELGYDDGEKDGASSVGSTYKIGLLVRFTAPKDGFVINKVKVYGYRFGKGEEWYGFGKSFSLEIWDNEFKTVYTMSSDYDRYFPQGEENIRWVEISIPSVKANNDFYVFFNTNSIKSPMVEGGIDVGMDMDSSFGRSFLAFANKTIITDPSKLEWSEGSFTPPTNRNWMIRVSNR